MPEEVLIVIIAGILAVIIGLAVVFTRRPSILPSFDSASSASVT